VVDVAHKVHPDLLPHRITVPQTPEQVYTVMMVSPQDEYTDVYVNPYGGSSRFAPLKQTRWLLIESHVHLFAGDLGMQVVGICGLLLLLISVTGLILWTGWRRLLASKFAVSLATGQLRSPQGRGILSVACS